MSKPVTITFENGFDWSLLNVQKMHLLNIIFNDMSEDDANDVPHMLEGIVEVIDEIQDQAADAGEPVVFADEIDPADEEEFPIEEDDDGAEEISDE